MGRSDQARRHQVRIAFVIPDCRKAASPESISPAPGLWIWPPRCARPRNDGYTFLATGLTYIGVMAKRPDRDPAKHSKKDPAKPTRAKVARLDSSPLDPALVDNSNSRDRPRSRWLLRCSRPPRRPDPGRAGAGRAASLSGGRGGGSGEGSRGRPLLRKAPREPCVTSRPPPRPLPDKGEGKSERPAYSSRRTIHSTAAPISPQLIGRASRRRV